MLSRIASLLALMACAGSPALAHHGWGEYDSTMPLTLTGTIKEAGYEHPHGHIRLETGGRTWLDVIASGRLLAYL
jgi:hypothetical protein